MLFRTRDLESFLKVLTFDKKRPLERYCRTAIVYGSDLAATIVECNRGVLPFHHRIHHRDIVPRHLPPTEASLDALSRNAAKGVGPLDRDGRKAARKVFALFDERRWLVGHMFFTAGMQKWHFFYFDQRDMAENANHWKGGPHIHLVNWLWPNLDPHSVWRDFVGENRPPSQALHIRYDPDNPPDQPDTADRRP